MPMSPTKDEISPRLNPFLFPSDTDFRFILLIVSVIGSSLHIFSFLFHSWWIPLHQQVFIDSIECSRDLGLPTDLLAVDNAYFQAQALCSAQINLHFSIWNLTAVAILLTVAFCLYWLIPTWKIWQDKLTPFLPESSQDINTCLEQLCQTAGLKKNPMFLMKPSQSTVGGVAFGHKRQRYVALSGALITKFKTDRPLFKAVVLHELAHLRNGDVDKTYFSVAIGIAFTFVAFVPFLIDNLYVKNEHQGLFDILDVGSLAILPLVLLVYLTLTSVLRARELYADARAATWGNSRQILRQFLQSSLLIQTKSKWPVYLRFHPNPTDRCQSLDTSNRFFQFSLWDAFATGMAAAIAIPTTSRFLLFFFSLPNFQRINTTPFFGIGTDLSIYSELLAALLLTPLAAGTVCLGIWRASFSQRLLNSQPMPAGKIGLALGAGLLIGHLFSFDIISSFFDLGNHWDNDPALLDHLTQLAFELMWGSILLLSLFLFCRWIAMGARLWIDVLESRRTLRRISITSCILIVIVLSALISGFFGLRSIFYILSGGTDFVLAFLMTLSAFLLTLVYSPVPLLLWIILWLYPLTAKYVTGLKPPITSWAWALLEPDTAQLQPSQTDSLSFSTILRTSFIVAVQGCIVYFLIFLVTRIAVRMSLPVSTRDTEFAMHIASVTMSFLGIFTQVGVALLVAYRAKVYSLIQGLFAAFIAGMLIANFAWTIHLIFNSTAVGLSEALSIFLNVKLWLHHFSVLVNLGAFSALLTLLFFAAIKNLFLWKRRSRKLSSSQIY